MQPSTTNSPDGTVENGGTRIRRGRFPGKQASSVVRTCTDSRDWARLQDTSKDHKLVEISCHTWGLKTLFFGAKMDRVMSGQDRPLCDTEALSALLPQASRYRRRSSIRPTDHPFPERSRKCHNQRFDYTLCCMPIIP